MLRLLLAVGSYFIIEVGTTGTIMDLMAVNTSFIGDLTFKILIWHVYNRPIQSCCFKVLKVVPLFVLLECKFVKIMKNIELFKKLSCNKINNYLFFFLLVLWTAVFRIENELLISKF